MFRAATAALAILIALECAAAREPPAPFTGAYIGGGGTYANVSVAYGDYYGWCCSYGDYEDGEEDTGYGIHAGYRLNPWFGIEAAYLDAGTLGWEESLVYVPDLNAVYNNRVDLDFSATELYAVGVLPFADRWEVYLKGGVAFWQAESAQALFDVETEELVSRRLKDDDEGLVFGLGLGVSLGSTWHLRLEFSSRTIDERLLNVEDGDASVDVVLFELEYRIPAR